MRRTGVLCTLLLMVVASCAFPQYGATQQQQESVVPELPNLTDEQKAALGEFWWQNQGVFNGEGNDGTVVVVQEPGSLPAISDQLPPFIPSPSPDCAAFQGCVPWASCIDGKFSTSGVGLLALRSPTKVPETNTQKLCGQIGSICCDIPQEILDAQQQAQGGGTVPYGGGAAGGEIIEVISTGGGTIAVVEQVADGVVVATGVDGAYVDDGAGGGIIEVIDGTVAGLDPAGAATGGVAVGPTVTVVEQISGGGGSSGATGGTSGETGVVSGTVGIIETAANGCPAYTHDCVPQFQCINGVINTSGEFLIDLRVKTRKCTDPEYPDVEGSCCRIPGATPPPTPPPTPAPLQTCAGTKVCVAQGQCNPDGTINTDGSGLINTRLYSSCYLEYVDASNSVTGVCCEPPPPPSPTPIVTCPGNQICVTKGFCAAQGTANYNPSEAVICYYEGGPTEGECCDPPITPAPTPAPLVTCPGTQECVDTSLCKNDGTINTDGTAIINVRVYHNRCVIDAATYATGVCCQPPTPPPPVTPAPLQTCPGDQICLVQGDCASLSAATDGAVTSYTTCIADAATYATGVCCQPPPPVTPAPLQTCPGNQICLSQQDCASQSAATGGAVTSYTSCVLDAATYATGVCCDSPIRVVDVCPDNSVCLPEILCQGEILNDADQYVPYGNTGTWTQCGLSGGLDTSGVCCRNPTPPEPTPSPLTAANACGVRNVPLDLRSGVKLEKNEATFGEFPWQAIIFFSNFTFKCGASIIDDRWLLTAAHCVHGYQYNDFRARLGEWQVDKYDEPLKYVDVEIASVTIHPDFKPGPVHNDVALIELTAPITPQYHINSVCLPQFNQLPAQGTRCFASGWGKDAFTGEYQRILKKISLPVVEKSYCQDLLRKTRLGKYFLLDESFMCAGGEENKDACEGDGGGPLVCEDPETGRYYVAGITAWGIDCGVKDVPGVYADVQLFRPWIDGIINPLEQQQQGPSGYGRK